MSQKTIKICHLYPKTMNIYGDTGNVKALIWRLEKRGIKVILEKVDVGDKLKGDTDILFAGGGQDSGQHKIATDLSSKKAELRAFHQDGVVMFTVCGMYQLFGSEFITHEGKVIPGAGVIDFYTEASKERHIGNIIIESEYGRLVGFENHSGLTYLGPNVSALGQVINGTGNNISDKGEGVAVANTFGTYMHGPLLPKNPVFADELLLRALSRKYGVTQFEHIDDSLAERAASIAAKRPR